VSGGLDRDRQTSQIWDVLTKRASIPLGIEIPPRLTSFTLLGQAGNYFGG
jgi:hypothetical protein